LPVLAPLQIVTVQILDLQNHRGILNTDTLVTVSLHFSRKSILTVKTETLALSSVA
jgi:hypothetical protein